MPISFATVLGGVVTLVGTSTNLVAAGLMTEAGMAPLGMFELTGAGAPAAVLGLAVLIALAPGLLPDRRPARRALQDDLREFGIHCTVVLGGPLDGETVEGGGLRHLQGVFLVEVQRAGGSIAAPAPSTVLRGGDRLAFAGRVDTVRDVRNMRGLVPAEHNHGAGYDSADHTFFEAVAGGASPLVGKTLRQAAFRERHQAAVLAIHRAGQRVNAKLGTVPLREGDTLLLLSDDGFAPRWRDRSDFLLMSRLGGAPPPSSRQARFVGLLTLALVVVAELGIVPILEASLVAAAALVGARVPSPAQARAAVDVDVLVVIAASFGLGAAIERSGLAALLARGVVEGVAELGPVAVPAAVTVAAMLLTELITNNAAAVLLFPLAMAAAARLELNPRAFAVAVAIAASTSFVTPIGYQTNTMVYGMGGYRFGDFARLGLPVTLVSLAAIVIIVPLFWPL